MHRGCDCPYCKQGVNEYFCSKCGHNYNECESPVQNMGFTLCPRCHPKLNSHVKIPNYEPTFQELSKQMRINSDVLMKEITEHANKEIKRIRNSFK